MCGRYSLALRAAEVRAYLQNENMPVYEAPADEGDGAPRQSYNFAPGYNGLVYRADVPYWGAGSRNQRTNETETPTETETEANVETDTSASDEPLKYKLQTMKWGLIPFWTKRNPDYGSMMKTINCRDDSLIENKGMWNTMKQKKRCVVVAQGFYEWLKKNGGKEKIPHYMKRKDGRLLLMAGLWDCVQYEESDEKIWTYTIITTSSNKQLNFLHDRMPVILENGSEELRTWLDPKRSTWSPELQSLLQPFSGELELYPVSQAVGKVGNNSPSFIIPVASKENKSNIANFFANAKDSAKGKEEKRQIEKEKEIVETAGDEVKPEVGEERKTVDHEGTEDNAPLPVPETKDNKGIKREHPNDSTEPLAKIQKQSNESPKKATPRKMRSATSNGTASPAKSPNKGSQKITDFFRK